MVGNPIIGPVFRILSRAWHHYLVQPVVRWWPKGSGKRVLCYGDSNTWGSVPGTGLRFRVRQRWPGIVQQQLGREVFIIEEGLPGRTTILDDPEGGGRNGKTSLLPYMRRYQPLALVILVLGTNDLKTHFNRTAEQIAQGVQELGEIVLTSQASGAAQSPLVLVVAPPPVRNLQENVSYFKDAPMKSRLLAENFQKVAQKLQCEFLDAGTVIQSSSIDGVHWEEAAHRDLGVVIAKKVSDLLGRENPERSPSVCIEDRS